MEYMLYTYIKEHMQINIYNNFIYRYYCIATYRKNCMRSSIGAYVIGRYFYALKLTGFII